MGILCPVILPATGVVTPRNTKFAQRRTVGSELVGDDGGWSDALTSSEVSAWAWMPPDGRAVVERGYL